MSPSGPVNLPQNGGPERSQQYFSSPELAQRTDLLRHLTENSSLIPLVRGAEGMGKTTFIHHLLDLAPENWIPVEIDADVMQQPETLLANLARLFDLNDTSGDVIEMLVSHFDDLRQDGLLPVIIVDDAHLLPEASIIALLRLHETGPSDNPLAQILLFAKPEIDDLLKTPQLRAMNLQSLQLLDMPVFTKEQTECYLKHLLAADDSTSPRPLSPVQIEKIYRDTGGLPGLIKQQAIALMSASTNKSVKLDLTEFISNRTVLGGGAALLVVLLVLIFQDSINDIFSQGEDPVEATQETRLPGDKAVPLALPDAPAKPELTADIPQYEQTASMVSGEPLTPEGEDSDPGLTRRSGPKTVKEVNKELVSATESPNETQQPIMEAAQPESTAETKRPDKEDKAVADGTPASAVTASSEESPIEQDLQAQKQVAPQPENTEKNPVAQNDSAAVGEPADSPVRSGQQPKVSQVDPVPAKQEAKPAAPKITAPAPAPQAKPKSSPPVAEAPVIPVEERSTTLVKKEVPMVKLAQKPLSQVQKKPASATRITNAGSSRIVSAKPMREDWLLKQKAASYTIQLVGLQEEGAIPGFIRRYPLPGPVAYYRTLRNGKPWFPVLHGVYPDRKMANEALERFPEMLRKSGVWLRTIGSVQKEISAR